MFYICIYTNTHTYIYTDKAHFAKGEIEKQSTNTTIKAAYVNLMLLVSCFLFLKSCEITFVSVINYQPKK